MVELNVSQMNRIYDNLMAWCRSFTPEVLATQFATTRLSQNH